MKQAPSLLAILLLSLLFWGGEYLVRDFWEPDEARYAYVAEEMWEGGHWAVPHRHGVPYAHKPPLMFWLINASSVFTHGEVSRVGVRLPSLLGAVLSLWVISRLALRWVDAATAWRAMAITATTYLFWSKGGMGQIDMLLCGLVMMALYHLLAYEWDRRWWHPALAYLTMGFAILAKGPVGLLVPLGMYAASTLAARDHTPRWHAHYLWALPLAGLAPAAWLAWAWYVGAPAHYFHELIFSQNVGRVAGQYGHIKPFYYFAAHFPLEFMPWTPFWLAILPAYRAQATPGRVTTRRLLAAVLFVLVLFSLSTSKRELYILPAYPAAALLTATAWPWIAAHARRAATRYFIAILALGAVGLLGASAADGLLNVLTFNGLALLLPGLAAAAGLASLLRTNMRHETGGSVMLARFTASLAAVLVLISTAVYATLNPLKGPYRMAEAANQLLPPGVPIFLYGMHGEIMPLYANRSGREFRWVDELEAAVAGQRHSLIVAQTKSLAAFPARLTNEAYRVDFRMGNKDLAWLFVHGQPGS